MRTSNRPAMAYVRADSPRVKKSIGNSLAKFRCDSQETNEHASKCYRRSEVRTTPPVFLRGPSSTTRQCSINFSNRRPPSRNVVVNSLGRKCRAVTRSLEHRVLFFSRLTTYKTNSLHFYHKWYKRAWKKKRKGSTNYILNCLKREQKKNTQCRVIKDNLCVCAAVKYCTLNPIKYVEYIYCVQRNYVLKRGMTITQKLWS